MPPDPVEETEDNKPWCSDARPCEVCEIPAMWWKEMKRIKAQNEHIINPLERKLSEFKLNPDDKC